jgi:hypothetical protein
MINLSSHIVRVLLSSWLTASLQLCRIIVIFWASLICRTPSGLVDHLSSVIHINICHYRSHLRNKCHWIIMNHPPAPTKRIRSSCHSWVSRLCFAWRNLLLSHFLLVFLEDSAHPDRFIQDPWSKAKPPEWLNNGIQQQVRSGLMMLHDCFMFHTTTINLEASSIFIILSPIVLGIPWYS